MLNHFFPTRAQYRSWSLPSKLTFFGACIGFVSLIISLVSIITVDASSQKEVASFENAKKFQIKALLSNDESSEDVVIREYKSWSQPLKSKSGNPSSYSVYGERYSVRPTSFGYYEIGTASWYGEKYDGRRTSSGDIFLSNEFSAAHRTLPLPSYVRVTNLENERSIVVKINDRGPFKSESIIELSKGASVALGIYPKKIGRVEVISIPSNRNLLNAIIEELPN